MTGKSLHELGTLQLEVMEVVWELGEATVVQVRERLRRKKKRAYTTVLSSLQKLEKAGWVGHRAEKRAYFYQPTCSREDAGSNALQKFLKLAFRGDRLLMFQHLLENETLSEKDLATLKKMIENRRKETRDE